MASCRNAVRLCNARPTSDKDLAQEHCLRHNINVPDLVTVKDFLRFYIATSQPVLTKKPTVDSINTVAEWFFAGVTRLTGKEPDVKKRRAKYII